VVVAGIVARVRFWVTKEVTVTRLRKLMLDELQRRNYAQTCSIENTVAFGVDLLVRAILQYFGFLADLSQWANQSCGVCPHIRPLLAGFQTRDYLEVITGKHRAVRAASKSVKLQRPARATVCSHSITDATASVNPS
jgi:hypothetical protein